MNRILYIDGFGNNLLPNRVILLNISQVKELYSQYSTLDNPEPLVIDGRALEHKALSGLLKFIEEYKNSITLIVLDPVLPTIMSRFIEIKKYPLIDKTLSFKKKLIPQKLQQFLI